MTRWSDIDKKPLHILLFELPDDALVVKCEESDFDPHPKIDSICQWWHDYERLSEKQKWCLAYFAAYGTVDGKPPSKWESKEGEGEGRHPQPYDDDDIPF